MNIHTKLLGCLVLLSLPLLPLQAASTDLIDLTYPFDSKTIYWPTEKGFSLKKFFYGLTPKGYFYSAYHYCAPEHGGTHIDAPRHFSKEGLAVDQLPVSQFMGPAVVIDVQKQVEQNRDYAITVEDIKNFEKHYRPLNAQDIVIFRTGWGQYWGDKKKYLGTDKFGDVKHLHFPGISKEAAQYLVDHKVKAIGLDTPSLDPGVCTEFWAHRIILPANLYGIENVANSNVLPPVGATLIVAPMKIAGGSGAPSRLYALMP